MMGGRRPPIIPEEKFPCITSNYYKRPSKDPSFAAPPATRSGRGFLQAQAQAPDLIKYIAERTSLQALLDKHASHQGLLVFSSEGFYPGADQAFGQIRDERFDQALAPG